MRTRHPPLPPAFDSWPPASHQQIAHGLGHPPESALTELPLGLESLARPGFGLCPNRDENLRACSCEYGQMCMHRYRRGDWFESHAGLNIFLHWRLLSFNLSFKKTSIGNSRPENYNQVLSTLFDTWINLSFKFEAPRAKKGYRF